MARDLLRGRRPMGHEARHGVAAELAGGGQHRLRLDALGDDRQPEAGAISTVARTIVRDAGRSRSCRNDRSSFTESSGRSRMNASEE